MRKVVMLFGLMALFASMSAAAQTKMAGTLTCNKADPSYKVEAGDRPGHAYMMEKNACTWTKPADVGGDKTKDGYSVSSTELTATRAIVRGTHVTTMASGDKTFVAFSDSYAIKDGKPADSNGQWAYVGGTGKLRGLTGKGTYRATPNADGTITVAVQGEYRILGPVPK